MIFFIVVIFLHYYLSKQKIHSPIFSLFIFLLHNSSSLCTVYHVGSVPDHDEHGSVELVVELLLFHHTFDGDAGIDVDHVKLASVAHVPCDDGDLRQSVFVNLGVRQTDGAVGKHGDERVEPSRYLAAR